MLTLINDEFAYCDLFNADYRKTAIKSPYFKREYDKNSFDKELLACLGEENILCDFSLYTALKDKNNVKLISDEFLNLEPVKNFDGFNIAIYKAFCPNDILNIVSCTKAKVIDFECADYENGARFLDLDSNIAFQKAAKIMLDAYDSGADFMLVADALSFKMFDTYSKELMRASNRDFDEFYVLHLAEFISLASGKTPKTLKEHKLKVSLI